MKNGDENGIYRVAVGRTRVKPLQTLSGRPSAILDAILIVQSSYPVRRDRTVVPVFGGAVTSPRAILRAIADFRNGGNPPGPFEVIFLGRRGEVHGQKD